MNVVLISLLYISTATLIKKSSSHERSRGKMKKFNDHLNRQSVWSSIISLENMEKYINQILKLALVIEKDCSERLRKFDLQTSFRTDILLRWLCHRHLIVPSQRSISTWKSNSAAPLRNSYRWCNCTSSVIPVTVFCEWFPLESWIGQFQNWFLWHWILRIMVLANAYLRGKIFQTRGNDGRWIYSSNMKFILEEKNSRC